METDQNLAGARRRTSSYGGDNGGDRIEVADLSAHVAVRDSENPEGPAFPAGTATFAAFVSAAAEGSIGR
ncbi:DUF397 domain-containing protein [Streptomyces filamentosus]|uniref:DUF397 domain-containing protein n=1 Tax=Streptomyces filamentosus TaxID=67294 RepID=A0A919BUC4_STRFL|nr:DUF397 domain-containing protein [Streptomyces filamentosus]GHG15938.1 hypothetical protein GCM10017667_57040 [Streptomyces filamentosus]